MVKMTGELYQEFLKYFSNSFQKLRAKFPKEIEWTLIKAPYGVRKPIDMTIEDYDDFREIELRWRIENDVLHETQNEPMFALVESGLAQINTNNVTSVKSLTNKSSQIKGPYNNGLDFSFDVIGAISFVRKKLEINHE